MKLPLGMRVRLKYDFAENGLREHIPAGTWGTVVEANHYQAVAEDELDTSVAWDGFHAWNHSVSDLEGPFLELTAL